MASIITGLITLVLAAYVPGGLPSFLLLAAPPCVDQCGLLRLLHTYSGTCQQKNDFSERDLPALLPPGNRYGSPPPKSRNASCTTAPGRPDPCNDPHLANYPRSHRPEHVDWKSSAIKMADQPGSLTLAQKSEMMALEIEP